METPQDEFGKNQAGYFDMIAMSEDAGQPAGCPPAEATADALGAVQGGFQSEPEVLALAQPLPWRLEEDTGVPRGALTRRSSPPATGRALGAHLLYYCINCMCALFHVM